MSALAVVASSFTEGWGIKEWIAVPGLIVVVIAWVFGSIADVFKCIGGVIGWFAHGGRGDFYDGGEDS